MTPSQGLLQTVLASPGRLTCLPRSVMATWATAFGFIAILVGGWLHTKVTIERQHRQHVAAMTQLAAARAERLFDQGSPSLEADAALQTSFVKTFDSRFLGEGDVVALYDLSGRLLAALPVSRAGRDFVTPSPEESPGEIVYRSSPTGEGMYLVGIRPLLHHPFQVAYGQSMDAQLADWQLQKMILALAAIMALVVTAAISGGIQRRLTLTTQLQRLHGELEASNNALRAALQATELIAAKDQLTGLWNRRSFDQRLEEAVAHTARHDGDFSLLLIDIDHFKSINDRFGHIVGDDVLRRFAEALHERLRQNDVAARWGGEEFVILADGASLENACQLAEQIREAIAATAFPRLIEVTASIGVSAYTAGDTSDKLLSRADQALYEAKRSGRDRVVAAGSAEQGRFFFVDRTTTEPSLFA